MTSPTARMIHILMPAPLALGLVIGWWSATGPARAAAAETEIGSIEPASYTSSPFGVLRHGRCDRCRPRYYVPEPCPIEDGSGVGETAPSEAVSPSDSGNLPPTDSGAAAPPSMMASALGAAPAPGAVTPNMIGDSLFGGLPGLAVHQTTENVGGSIHATLPLAGGDRRFKMAENTSPRPQNRVYFNYNHFQNPLIDVNGRNHNLDRFGFGMEKTFFCDLASIELRVPFSSSLNSRQASTGSFNGNAGTEFGDLALALKGVLWQTERTLVSAGLGITFPTGDDALFQLNGGFDEIRIDNDVVHLQPFLGIVHTHNERLFVQGYVQFDFSTDENGLTYTTAQQTAQTQALYDQHLVYLDVAAGYWLQRNRCARLVTGIAPVVELHYTSTLNDATTPTIGNGNLNNAFNRMDVLNLTGGLVFEMGPRTNLTVAAVAPLRENEERIFDAEVLLQFNRRF